MYLLTSRGLLITILSLVAAVVLVIAAFFFVQKNFAPRGNLQVTTFPSGAKVTMAGKEVGTSPYQGEFQAGEYLIKVEDTKRVGASWQAKITLSAGTLTTVERDLGPSEDFSSGTILSLSRGSGLSVISSPSGATVYLDGTDIGTTPVSRPAPSPGAHRLKVQLAAYFDKEISINVTSGWKLAVSTQLYKNPDFGAALVTESKIVPQSSTTDLKIIKRETTGLDKIASSSAEVAAPTFSKAQLFDLGTPDKDLAADPLTWMLGLAYHAVFHLGLSDLPFHYLIDSQGAVYEGRSTQTTGLDPTGGITATSQNPTLKPGVLMVGYLGLKGGPTTPALASFQKLLRYVGSLPSSSGASSQVSHVKILDTGTGFLRVRSGPGTSYPEISRVTPGDVYELLDESSGWYKIKLSPDVSGWVSSQFASKI
jgi:hypothetical protein